MSNSSNCAWTIGLTVWLSGLAGCAQSTRYDYPAPVPASQSTAPSQTPISTESLIHLGQSTEGRALDLILFGRGPCTALVLGGIHGNERNSAQTAEALVTFLRKKPAALGGRSIAVLACANPDGNARGIRTNARSVDLNRNFPASNWEEGGWKGPYFSGPIPLSEPESQAIIAAITRLAPARIISIHSTRTPCNNWDGPAEPIAQLMSLNNGYAVRSSMGYTTPGSLGSWAGVDRKIPTITLELPSGEPGVACWEQNRDALLAAITHVDGRVQ